jgi:hypothetical protein
MIGIAAAFSDAVTSLREAVHLAPIRDTMWKSHSLHFRDPEDDVIALERLLIRFLRRFPVCLESHSHFITITISRHLTSANAAVLKCTRKLLKTALGVNTRIEAAVRSELTQHTSKSCIGAVMVLRTLSAHFRTHPRITHLREFHLSCWMESNLI